MIRHFLYFTGKKSVFLYVILLILNSYKADAQFLPKLPKIAKDIKNGVSGVKQVVKEVTGTSVEITKSVKTLKKTWTKDTSSNIKYYQVPDYRSREDVDISQKQKLNFEDGKFKNINWQPVINFDNQIFPSFVISWNTYKGTKTEDFGSSVGFGIRTNLPKVVFKWEIECIDKSFFNIDSGYINCDELLGNNFMPKISWNVSTLAKQQISTPLTLIFRLKDPITNNSEERIQKVSLRSINDCLTGYNGVSYDKLYVAYVNEDHPEIETILKNAMDTKMIDNIQGYLGLGFNPDMSKSEYLEAVNKVDLEIAAIWRVLHDRGFQYSSITSNSVNKTSGLLSSQTVRPFAMSVKTNQANCVDGSVMIASVLKRVGLNTSLVLIPGHCFLAYSFDNGHPNFDKWREELSPFGKFFIETTAMSDITYLNKDSVSRNFKAIIKPSYPSFNLKTATEKDKEYFLQFLKIKDWGIDNFFTKEGKLIDINTVTFININNERKNIPPLPIQ